MFGRSTRTVLEAVLAEIERNRIAYEEQLQFTREVIRRNEIAFLESRKALEDLVEEVNAQRGALLALIDEIRGGGPQPQAG